MKLIELQQMIGRGEYRVEPGAVADAIVRKLLAQRPFFGGSRGAQPKSS